MMTCAPAFGVQAFAIALVVVAADHQAFEQNLQREQMSTQAPKDKFFS
jgi:hypothetical protein